MNLEQVILLQAEEEHSLPHLSLNIQLCPTRESTNNQAVIDTYKSQLELVFTYVGNEQKTIQHIPVYNNGLIEKHSSQSLKESPLGIFLKPYFKSLFLTTSNISFDHLAALWDKITLTP